MSTKAKYQNALLRYFESTTDETVDVMAPVLWFDDFTGAAIDATNDYVVAGVNGGTAAINVAICGTVRITTGAADDDDVDMATSLVWSAGKSCCAEARIACADVAHTAFNFGFSDATGEAADKIAVTFAAAAATTTATDFAGFFLDADATSNVIRAMAVKNNTDSAIVATSTTPADNEYHVYRVEIDADGNVSFFVDGARVGGVSAAITTTVALCVYVGFINREAAANTLDVDYIKAWQKR